MAENGPSKTDIEAIFKRLRSLPTNKTCFDCGAKNPTWSSVTYGVFICIDCSAVHRSLGVHITFVRSTQLDTAWTWPQLRNMQLGGNANAHTFFMQHNCTSTDSQQKYKSRAAQLYREKLANMSAQAMRLYANQVHIETSHSSDQAASEKKEVDFFSQAETEAFNKASYGTEVQATPAPVVQESGTMPEPNAEALINPAIQSGDVSKSVGKSIINQRKTATKKPGLGAKKGLGAMKIQTNFEDIEREAQMADQLRTKVVEPQVKQQEPDEKQMASLRLAYQDLSVETKKQAEKLQKVDPNKAQQMERLGMGILGTSNGARNVSHSALGDMHVIQQDSSGLNSSSVLASLDRKKSPFSDDHGNQQTSIFNKSSGIDDLFSKPTSSYDDRWDMLEELSQPSSVAPKSSSYYGSSTSSAQRSSASNQSSLADNSAEAQKKFGNAKAISSDQFFRDSEAVDYERRTNLLRFEGSSSISSSDYFGTGSSNSNSRSSSGAGSSAYNLQAPDFDEVKESVRQGVTKVASRLSNMANNLANSIQERYGY